METNRQPARSTFASDVLTLATGTIFAQVLAILAAPLLTRMYGPDDFGLYTIFLSVTGILTSVACMRYEMAIMLPERNEDAVNLLALSLLLAACMSIIIIPLLWVARVPMIEILNAPGLAPYLWMVPLAVFLGGAFNALNYWNSRTRHFKRLSMSRVIGSVTVTGAQIGAGLAGHATGGSMIDGSISGQMASTTFLGAKIYNDIKHLKKYVSKAHMILGLKRYHKFPLLDMWSILLNTLSWQVPVFLLSAFFSSTVVGYYSLGFRVIYFPMSIIGSSIAQVFFQRAVEANAKGSLNKVAENLFHGQRAEFSVI